MAVGLTVAEPPVYTYVAAPVGFMMNEDPLQMAPEFTEIVGFTFTVTDAIAVPKQPAALAPVTV